MKIIRAGTLIDGTGAPAVRDAVIQIDNGRIEAVTTAGPSGGWPSGTEVIDASGLTVLPGLIDCHDHLAFHGYELAKRWGLDEPRSTWHLRTASVARQILESGYTAIRDAGGLDAGLRVAIEAGVDSIEHGCYLDEDRELIPMMAERHIFFVPTLTVYEYHRESPAPHVRERAHALRAHHVESVGRALAAGVKVVAGTDAGGHGHPSNALEPALLVAAGMTPMRALQAATGRAAECLGLEAEIGTVEKGKWADLVFVDGDPLRDITLLQDKRRIKRVLKGGVAVRG